MAGLNRNIFSTYIVLVSLMPDRVSLGILAIWQNTGAQHLQIKINSLELHCSYWTDNTQAVGQVGEHKIRPTDGRT